MAQNIYHSRNISKNDHKMEHHQRNEEEEEEVYVDDVMLPGFRFHPTDEELVDFYLKRKTLNQPLSIELIRQLDIYKYDPWDLPKLAITGEKEWYFYCQRDRKYRNSARPNRVTEAGFWKATGTDRPIYSSNNNNGGYNNKSIIGLKKSLVFYKGRASKALKTDWMMHEFRLPNHSPNIISPYDDQVVYLVKIVEIHDSWAICRIFKKTNISAAQRAVSSSLPRDEITNKDDRDKNGLVLPSKTTQNVPSTNNTPCNFPNSYDPLDYLEGKLPQLAIPTDTFAPHSFTFEPMEVSDIAKSAMDVSSILLNMSSSLLGDFDSSWAAETSDPFTSFQSLRQPDNFSSPTMLLPQMQGYDEANALLLENSKPLESVSSSSIGYPLSCIWDKLLN